MTAYRPTQNKRYQPPAVAWVQGAGLWHGMAPWFAGWWISLGALALSLHWSEGIGPALVSVFAVLCAGMAAVWEVRAPARRCLAWDQCQWTLSLEPRSLPAAGVPQSALPCTVQTTLDLQGVLLLRVIEIATKRVHWLWLSQRSDPANWHRLRCALFGAGQP